MTKAEIKAIPTLYNGQQYRSRLEADMASTLDRLAIPFEYEATSYLLDGGVHYRPDFLCYGRKVIIETRGYSSDKGNKQIRTFLDAVYRGKISKEVSVAVVRDDRDYPPAFASYYCEELLSQQAGTVWGDWSLYLCDRDGCDGVVPLGGWGGHPCPKCDCWRRPGGRHICVSLYNGALHFMDQDVEFRLARETDPMSVVVDWS